MIKWVGLITTIRTIHGRSQFLGELLVYYDSNKTWFDVEKD